MRAVTFRQWEIAFFVVMIAALIIGDWRGWWG